MTTQPVHTSGRPTTTFAGATIRTCAFGHHTHCGTCAGCQQVQQLRHAAQLNAATVARAQWLAGLH